MPPDDRLDDAKKWLRYAEADLAIAEAPLPAHGLYEHLTFHAQQAAEKAIKAILVLHGIDFPKTHNIEYLLTLLPSDIARENLPSQAYRLTAYATVFRYPGDEEPVSEENSRELTAIGHDTVAWAMAIIRLHS
jgi:HEPN domain-containing protein